MHAHTHTHTHMHSHTHTLTLTYTSTHTHSHSHTHTLTHLHSHTHAYTQAHTHAHTHSHTHTHREGKIMQTFVQLKKPKNVANVLINTRLTFTKDLRSEGSISMSGSTGSTACLSSYANVRSKFKSGAVLK